VKRAVAQDGTLRHFNLFGLVPNRQLTGQHARIKRLFWICNFLAWRRYRVNLVNDFIPVTLGFFAQLLHSLRVQLRLRVKLVKEFLHIMKHFMLMI